MYEGKWKDGVFEGHGIYKLANGDVYEGEFQNGKKEGQGILKDEDGEVLEQGKWENDKFIE